MKTLSFDAITALTTDKRTALFNVDSLATAAGNSANVADSLFTNAIRAWITDPAAHTGDVAGMWGDCLTIKNDLKGTARKHFSASMAPFDSAMRFAFGASLTGKGKERTMSVGDNGETYTIFAEMPESGVTLTASEARKHIADHAESVAVVTNATLRSNAEKIKAASLDSIGFKNPAASRTTLEKKLAKVADSEGNDAFTEALAVYNAEVSKVAGYTVIATTDVVDAFAAPAPAKSEDKAA